MLRTAVALLLAAAAFAFSAVALAQESPPEAPQGVQLQMRDGGPLITWLPRNRSGDLRSQGILLRKREPDRLRHSQHNGNQLARPLGRDARGRIPGSRLQR